MSKSRIHIVEDDSSLAEVLDYNLRQEGYETQVSRDGQQGLREIRLRLPDLVVLDLMLPLVDGLEVCRQLRKDPATQDILVLMLTARSEESDQLVGFSVGADDYVTKPFSVKVNAAADQRPAASQRPTPGRSRDDREPGDHDRSSPSSGDTRRKAT